MQSSIRPLLPQPVPWVVGAPWDRQPGQATTMRPVQHESGPVAGTPRRWAADWPIPEMQMDRRLVAESQSTELAVMD